MQINQFFVVGQTGLTGKELGSFVTLQGSGAEPELGAHGLLFGQFLQGWSWSQSQIFDHGAELGANFEKFREPEQLSLLVQLPIPVTP